MILESQTNRQTYRVEEVFELSRSDFSLSGKVTRLRLDKDDGFADFTVRGTTVYLQSQPLDLADLPIVDPVAGNRVILDGTYLELAIGQTVILTGTRADLAGVVDSEAMTIADIDFTDGYTTLTFQQALTNSYVRASVTINANVAPATHGETVQEILGSGDASQSSQTFTLRQPPLTYVSSDAPSGQHPRFRSASTTSRGAKPRAFSATDANDRVFVTQTGDDGSTTVEFGDGVTGARPATGSENITAIYRKGMGAAGNVDAGKITLLPVRPLGVRGVINPLPASGATDPEQRDDIRRNAALTILTLDRIVSLQDYEDFARAFAGIAKALATWSWIGQTRGVFVTVAGPTAPQLADTGQTYINLLAAMRKARRSPCAAARAVLPQRLLPAHGDRHDRAGRRERCGARRRRGGAARRVLVRCARLRPAGRAERGDGGDAIRRRRDRRAGRPVLPDRRSQWRRASPTC